MRRPVVIALLVIIPLAVLGAMGIVDAETLAEHNANVKKWYDIRRARGESLEPRLAAPRAATSSRGAAATSARAAVTGSGRGTSGPLRRGTLGGGGEVVEEAIGPPLDVVLADERSGVVDQHLAGGAAEVSERAFQTL